MANAQWGSRPAPVVTNPGYYQPQQPSQQYRAPEPQPQYNAPQGYHGNHPAAQPQQQPQQQSAQHPGRVARNEPPIRAAAPTYAQPHQPAQSQAQSHAHSQGHGSSAQLDPAYHGYAGQMHHPHAQPQMAPQGQYALAHDYDAAAPQPDYQPEPSHGGGGSGRFTRVVNGVGALTSLALVAGLAVWGYNLVVRDATEVPVVAAIEGAMRVMPDNPGGESAENQGLAVNNVAADGVAEGPAEQVLLAPGAEDLAPDDEPAVSEPVLAATPDAEAGEFRPEEEVAATDVSAESDDVRAEALALADEIANGQEPLTDGEIAASAVDDAVEEAMEGELEVAAAEVVTGPGPKVSPIPRARPENLVARAAAQPSTDALLAATDVATNEVAAADIPAGTRLVQLGAYDTEDVARAEWDALSGRFDEYLSGKSRVIEQAQSGGKTFYRLRAMGFEDLSDARRFCAALMAGQAACIPVVTR